MGFFSKLGNWIRGKGWKEPTKKKVEEIKEPDKIRVTTEKERDKTTEQVKDINEIIPKTEEEKQQEKNEEQERRRILQETPKEELTELGKQEIETDEQEDIIKTSIEQGNYIMKNLPVSNRLPTENQINELVNKAMTETENYQEIFIDGTMTDGTTYGQLMKQAILNSGAKIDDNIAELIATNYDKFRYRFTSKLIIDLETEKGTEQAYIDFFGSTPKDIGDVIKEIQGIEIGTSISGSELYKKMQQLIKQLREYGKTMNASEPRIPDITGTCTINNIRMATHFR